MVDATYTLSSNATKYQPILEGLSQFVSLGGVVQVKDVKFAARPGYSYRVSFTTDGIDETKTANENYLKESKLDDLDFKMTI